MPGRIPREFIHQLLSRIDIVNLIDSRFVLKKKSGSNFFACCPFHTEKSASFSVSQPKQFYHCFGCGAHGNVIDFLMQYDRLSFPEAVEALARQAGLTVPHEGGGSVRAAPPPGLHAVLEKACSFYRQSLKNTPAAIAWLRQRGVSGEMAKQFGLGYAPPGWDNLLQALGNTDAQRTALQETGMLIRREDGQYHDRFRDRLLFPIHDRRGQVTGFGGRLLHPGEPKYLNSPETPLFHKGREVYGLHHVLSAHHERQRILVVEGYMDVIALVQYGIDYAVATLGTATTAFHLQTLFRHTPEIVFCFDGDSAGRSAAWRALLVALPEMEEGRQISFMFLPDGEDPDTLVRRVGGADFIAQLETAVSLSHFFFQTLSAQTDCSTLDGRARLASLAMEHLQQVPTGIFRNMMLEALAKRVRTALPALPVAADTRPARKPSAPARSRPVSPLRLLITLLTQYPELARHIDTPLPPLQQHGMELLAELLEMARATPVPTTGELLEHWRDRPESDLLARLACISLAIPAEGIEKECQGALQCLRKQAHEQAIAELLARAGETALSSEEKQTLTRLIQEKERLS